jgi:pyridoxamine 5'-phosphate oxidase family protein
MSFTSDEIEYLRSQPLARLSTVAADGQPDVVPVAFELEDDGASGSAAAGRIVLRSRKFRNVGDGGGKVALVVDDLVSLEPFIARGVRVYGRAGAPVERVGMVGPGTYVRITPTVSWSWNLAGEPVGENWYEARRTVWGGAA